MKFIDNKEIYKTGGFCLFWKINLSCDENLKTIFCFTLTVQQSKKVNFYSTAIDKHSSFVLKNENNTQRQFRLLDIFRIIDWSLSVLRKSMKQLVLTDSDNKFELWSIFWNIFFVSSLTAQQSKKVNFYFTAIDKHSSVTQKNKDHLDNWITDWSLLTIKKSTKQVVLACFQK